MARPAPRSALLDSSRSAAGVRRTWLHRLRPVHRATLGAVLAGVCGQGIVLVSGVLVTRILATGDRGLLQLLWLFPMVLTLVGGLGLPMATTYYIARDPALTRPIVRLLIRPVLVQAVVLMAVQSVILVRVLVDEPAAVQSAGFTTVLVVPALLAQQYGLGVLQGSQRFRPFNILRLLPIAVYSLVIVVVFVLGIGDLPRILLAWVGAYTLVGVGSLAVALHKPPPEPSAGVPPTLGQMVRFGLKGFLGWASPVDNLRIDQLVVGLFLSTPALGLYVVGTACANLPRLVAQSVGMVAYPRIAGRRNQHDAYHAIWRFFWFAVAICGVAVLALEVSVGWLVPFFFTREYAGAVSISRILLVGALLYGGRRVLADGARGAGYPMLDTLTEVLSWGVLVPAVAVMAPRHGALGVAWALVSSSAASLALLAVLLFVYRRRIRRRSATACEIDPAIQVITS